MRALIRRIDWMKVLDILGWLGFIYLVIYGFLRVFGIIHSPEIVDATAVASIAFFAGKHVMKLDMMEQTLRQHSRELTLIKNQLARHDTDIEKLSCILPKHY